MDLKDRIQELCRSRNVSMNQLETELGFGKGYISKIGKSTPNARKIQQIADYFNVSVDYLMNGNEATQLLYTCPDCGFTYVPTEYTDAKDHVERHNAWEKAVDKFGRLYCNGAENEKIKGINRNIRDDKNNPITKRYDAELKVLRCLFSRSVEASNFNLQHVPFEQYVAMMLNNPKYLKFLDPELTQKLILDYGTLPGIEDGHSYYDVPPIKRHPFTTRNITNAEYDQIKKYRDLDDHGKEMVDLVLDKEHARMTAAKVVQMPVKESLDHRIARAARNDHIDEPGELEKTERDLAGLQRPNR